MSEEKLTKAFLEKIYRKYNRINSANDPVWIVIHRKKIIDQEILGFIASQYAFGNIAQIHNTLKKIVDLLNPSPIKRILDDQYLNYLMKSVQVNHRFLFHNEFIGLLKTLRIVYNEFGSLKSLFVAGYDPDEINLKNSLSKFSNHLRKIHKEHSKISQRKLKFLYPSPQDNSACKRFNLFLRWMVRKDNVDLGLWKEIKTTQLVIPLDTHIYQISKYFGLTKRKSPSWNMAVEITENLKKFDSNDPVKYDFALSHLNIRILRESLLKK